MPDHRRADPNGPTSYAPASARMTSHVGTVSTASASLGMVSDRMWRSSGLRPSHDNRAMNVAAAMPSASTTTSTATYVVSHAGRGTGGTGTGTAAEAPLLPPTASTEAPPAATDDDDGRCGARAVVDVSTLPPKSVPQPMRC